MYFLPSSVDVKVNLTPLKVYKLRISIPQSFYCMQSSSGNKRSVRVQSGLSARLVDEKELVDKNYHKFKGFLNRND
jgi:hypothetical protein